MPARTTRQAARERLRAIFEAELERMIPADEQTPLKGRLFAEFEDQTEELVAALGRGALEERTALDGSAAVEEGGTCPYCGSRSIYLERQETQPTLQSPQGPVRVALQHARCRRCDGSFSPAGAQLGPARRGGAKSACLSADRAGGDGARL